MERSQRTILAVVVLALLIICAVSIALAILLPSMLLRSEERNIDLRMSLIYYCDQDSEAPAEIDTTNCMSWADQFREEHLDIVRQCDDLAGLNLDELTAFSECLDRAGARAYLPTE